MYATINKLVPIAQELGARIGAAQEIQSVFGNVGAPGVAPSATPGATGYPSGYYGPTDSSPGAAPSGESLANITGSMGSTLLPLLLTGAALIIAVTANQPKGGARAVKRARR